MLRNLKMNSNLENRLTSFSFIKEKKKEKENTGQKDYLGQVSFAKIAAIKICIT